MPLKPFRAPSRQTLEFLREAALYGSLGTTVGVGVLLLEERRRRICYLRQIVENGKKLKEFRGKRLVHRCALTDQELEKLGDGAALTINIRKPYKTPPDDELSVEEQFRNRRRAHARRTGDAEKTTIAPQYHFLDERDIHLETSAHHGSSRPDNGPKSTSEKPRNKTEASLPTPHRSPPAASRVRKQAQLKGPFAPHKHVYRPPTAARHVPIYADKVLRRSGRIDPSIYTTNNAKVEERIPTTESASLEGRANGDAGADLESAAHELLAARTPETTIKSFYKYCLRKRGLAEDSTSHTFVPVPDYEECESLEDYVSTIGTNLQLLGLESVLNEFLQLTRQFKTAPTKYVAKLGQILLQLSAEPHLLGIIESTWMKLDQWNVLSLGCYHAVEDACAKLLHLDNTEDILPREQLVLKLLCLLNGSHAKHGQCDSPIIGKWNVPRDSDQAFRRILKKQLPSQYGHYIRKVFLRSSGDTENDRTIYYKHKWMKVAWKRCYQLFTMGKLVPSLQLFNEQKKAFNVTSRLGEELGPEAQKLLGRALRQPNYYLVTSIVQWLEEIDQFDGRAVDSILKYYREAGQHRLVSEMASKYIRSIEVRPDLVEMICESCVLSDTYDQAIVNVANLCERLREILQPGSQSPYESQEILEKYFIQLLQTRWKSTKNFQAVEDTFISMGPGASGSPSISRALLLIRNEAIGTDPYLVMNPNIRLAYTEPGDLMPVGPLLVKHAQANDWIEVETVIHRVRGLTTYSPQDSANSTSVFNIVFKIYCQNHTFEQAKSYAMDNVERFAISPSDEILYELLALALKDNCLSSISDMLRYFRRFTPDLAIDRVAARWLRVYWQQFHPASSTVSALLSYLGVHAPEILTPEISNIYERAQIFHYSKLSKRQRKNLSPAPMVTYKLPGTRHTTPDTPKTSLSKIYTWIAQKKWKNVVAHYEWLLSLGRPATGIILELTIKACLEEHAGDETVALSIIERAQSQGVNADLAMGHILSSRISHIRPDADAIREKISALFKYNDEKNIGMRHFVSVTAARDLLSRGMHRQAVKLLRDTHTAARAREETLGIEAMTCWAQAAAEANNLNEFESVLALVIEEGTLLDDKFIQAITPCYQSFKKRRQYQRIDHDPESLKDLWSRISTWKYVLGNERKAQLQHSIKLGFELCRIVADDVREMTPEYLRNEPSDEFTISKYIAGHGNESQIDSDFFADYKIPLWEVQDFPRFPAHFAEQTDKTSHDFYDISPEELETVTALVRGANRELEKVEKAPLEVAE